jgi:hypothetical protein
MPRLSNWRTGRLLAPASTGGIHQTLTERIPVLARRSAAARTDLRAVGNREAHTPGKCFRWNVAKCWDDGA